MPHVMGQKWKSLYPGLSLMKDVSRLSAVSAFPHGSVLELCLHAWPFALISRLMLSGDPVAFPFC